MAWLFVNASSRTPYRSNASIGDDSRKQINKWVHTVRCTDRRGRQQIVRNKPPLGWQRAQGMESRCQLEDAKPDERFDEGNDIRQLWSNENMGQVLDHCLPRQRKSTTFSLPRPQIEGISTDPFGQIKIPMNAERYHLLHYFILRFLPVNIPGNTYMFPQSPMRYTDLVKSSLSDPVHAYALLTASSARLRYFGGNTHPEAYAYLTARSLRQYLSTQQPVTQQLLFSIGWLRAHSDYDGQWEVVDAHDRFIKHLVNTYLGGFSQLDPLLREMLWRADRSQAAATGHIPVFREILPPNPVPEQLYNSIYLSIAQTERPFMGAEFDTLHSDLDHKFRHLLDKIVQLAHLVQHFWSGNEQPQVDPYLLTAHGFELLDRLHFRDVFDDSSAKTARSTEIQECLRITLVIWLTMVVEPMSVITANVPLNTSLVRTDFDFRPLQKHFGELIRDQSSSPVPGRNDLLLWIAGVGVLAFKQSSAGEWFSQHFQTLLQTLEQPRWDQFMRINDRYLWLDYIDRSRGNVLAVLARDPAID